MSDPIELTQEDLDYIHDRLDQLQAMLAKVSHSFKRRQRKTLIERFMPNAKQALIFADGPEGSKVGESGAAEVDYSKGPEIHIK